MSHRRVDHLPCPPHLGLLPAPGSTSCPFLSFPPLFTRCWLLPDPQSRGLGLLRLFDRWRLCSVRAARCPLMPCPFLGVRFRPLPSPSQCLLEGCFRSFRLGSRPLCPVGPRTFSTCHYLAPPSLRPVKPPLTSLKLHCVSSPLSPLPELPRPPSPLTSGDCWCAASTLSGL